jgi:hypothetical protein
MIDWYAKVQQLKASADELDLWAAKSEGHIRLVMGRTADELRQLARDVDLAMQEPVEQHAAEPQPDWLAGGVLPEEDWVQTDEPVDDHSGEWQPLE